MSDTTEGMSAAQASGKRGPKVCDKDYNETAAERDGIPPQGYCFAFTNGKVLQGTLADFPPDIVTQLTLHGLMQRGGDSYASVKGDIAKAFEQCSKVIDLLKSGEWGAKREGGDGVTALWVEALAELRNWRNDDGTPNMTLARERVAKMAESDEGKALLEKVKASDPIKAKVAEIRFKRAQEAMQKAQQEAEAKKAAGGEVDTASLMDQI